MDRDSAGDELQAISQIVPDQQWAITVWQRKWPIKAACGGIKRRRCPVQPPSAVGQMVYQVVPPGPSPLVNQTVFQPVNGSTSHCSALGPLLICESAALAYTHIIRICLHLPVHGTESGLAVTQRPICRRVVSARVGICMHQV